MFHLKVWLTGLPNEREYDKVRPYIHTMQCFGENVKKPRFIHLFWIVFVSLLLSVSAQAITRTVTSTADNGLGGCWTMLLRAGGKQVKVAVVR
jgi:hypothetical protein